MVTYDPPTKQVRLSTDLVEKLAAVVRFDPNLTTAGLLDPLVRSHIERLFEGQVPAEYRRLVLERIAKLEAPAE